MPEYSVEVVQRADTAGDPVVWANRFEILTDASIQSGEMLSIAQAIGAAWAQHLLCDAFRVDQVTISTWQPDGEPYNPLSFVTVPLNLRGGLGGGSGDTVLPITNVLHVRKLVPYGRVGHLFLRGHLREQDITSDALSGAVSIVNTAGIQARLNDFLAAFTSSATPVGLIMFDIRDNIPEQRPVIGLQIKGLSVRQLRTRRKARLSAASAATLSSIIADGQITPQEVVQAIPAIIDVLGALGVGPGLPALPA